MAFTGQRRALEDIDANEEPTKEERLLPQSAKSIHTYLINRLSDALSPKSKIFDAELKRTLTRAPYHIQPLGGPQLPWPVPIILTPVAPPSTEGGPALPPLPENY